MKNKLMYLDVTKKRRQTPTSRPAIKRLFPLCHSISVIDGLIVCMGVSVWGGHSSVCA